MSKVSYENMEYILQFFEGVHEEENRAELMEVYRKAKAWDRTRALLEKCTHQTPGDDYEVDWHEFEIKIDEVISDYESGEYDGKK